MNLWIQIGQKIIAPDTPNDPEAVKLLQRVMIAVGYPVAINGKYEGDNDTVKTLVQFQKDHHLANPDGKVGPITADALDKAANLRGKAPVVPSTPATKAEDAAAATPKYPVQHAARNWSGIIGVPMNAQQVHDYIMSLDPKLWLNGRKNGTAFKPQFVVLHNTWLPTLKMWRTQSTPQQRIFNLEDYFKNNQHWQAGPHAFIADQIFPFTPLWREGTHSPSWNAFSIGIEMVGNYDTEPFDPIVRDNTVAFAAAVHKKLGINPNTLRLHKEDTASGHHDCPGKNVNKADMIARITKAVSGA